MKAIYLCGPTAVGKSAVALELAQTLGREIVSVDSMQVYRGMDIGTAKPSAEERAKVRHHLVDVVDVTENFDAAKFVELARKASPSAAIYCGGTGLYFNALLQGLGKSPPGDPKLRAELEAKPLDALLEELKSADAAAYEMIDRSNLRRVVRALETIRLTGKPFAESRAKWTEITAPIFGLEMARDEVNRRIDARVDEMFKRGLVAETREMLGRGLRENRTASQALGYRQAIDHLDGKLSLAETIALVKTRTRQFAKRQMTWFKRQLPVQWMQVASNDSPSKIAQRLIDEHKLV